MSDERDPARGGCPYAHTNWTCAECGAGPGEPCHPARGEDGEAIRAQADLEVRPPREEVERAIDVLESTVASFWSQDPAHVMRQEYGAAMVRARASLLRLLGYGDESTRGTTGG